MAPSAAASKKIPMPKDGWKKARDRDIARRARFEIATGQPRSFEFLSEEVTPLDQINPSESRRSEGVPKKTKVEASKPKRKAKPRASEKMSRPPVSEEPRLAHYKIADGVSVLVKRRGNSRVSVAQALEKALEKARHEEVKIRECSKSVGLTTGLHTPARKAAPPPIELPLLRVSLKEIAVYLVERQAIESSWYSGKFHSWSFRLSKASSPAQMGRLMAQLAANISDGGRFGRSWRERRKGWIVECQATTSVDDAARLLLEFGNAILL